ncbi:hypothetical protein DL546_005388 [Coniochaeta pulveracea]|uniref:Zn(2)-C6 fungal-type domain-containing protein n=1 Tax=Coniochaeta pulveracea TaxID=177199 RepID=A0A420YK51_9PEZI|nr:hypothetical protein DL546_005388 [Coniochaeta pulveracea]
MRACEGCRRRKIKCDAATTNTWPCAACQRLKLHCVRPNGYDGSSTDLQTYEDVPQGQYDAMPASQEGYQQAAPMHEQQLIAAMPRPPPSGGMYAPQMSYQNPSTMYQQIPYQQASNMQSADMQPSNMQAHMQYSTMPQPQTHGGNQEDPSYSHQSAFPTPPLPHGLPQDDSSPGAYSQASAYNQGDLSDLLGSLNVNEAGTAPYLNSKMRRKTGDLEEPVLEDADDYKSALPPLATGPGLKIRIPPELMPDEETCIHYFDLYFQHVHPYVPVLDKQQFYQQWHSNRESLSPLIIEAVFAIAGRLADEPSQGQQWLALATRHADSFMDVPRLSTLQALLILLKAREAAPKRGYYYRSWMSIVQCVQMGKDLGLDEHHEIHEDGQSCGFPPAECGLRTRIWQTIFVCEVMIGSPQGRTDLQVDPETVDFNVPRPLPGEDPSEYNVSRNFVYFIRIVKNISRMNTIYARLKRTKEWGVDPEFVQLKPALHAWLTELPPDLAITFPADGSPPWPSSPFVGNLHSYYYLSLILFHRPTLAFLDPNGADGQWKEHMLICYNAAKMLCRLQEGMLQYYDLTGLQCMQRGINFTIYAILGCIVLHLVALASPDPDFNSDAREYFTRHMRILEKVMNAWPMPDMQKQLNELRVAFSADIRKPFDLKPSFPYGSPASTHSSPPRSNYPPTIARTQSIDQHLNTTANQQYRGHPITPPISAGPVDSKGDVQGMAMMMGNPGSQGPTMHQHVSLADVPAWNPAPIFASWNTAFGTQPVQPPPVSTGQSNSLSVSSSGAAEIPTAQDIQAVHSQLPPGGAQQLYTQYTAAPVQPFSAAYFQENVAMVYESGLKRGWDHDGTMSISKRR